MSLANRFIEAVEPQLSRVLSAIRRIERYLGPDDDWVERLRRTVWVAADPVLRPLGRPTVAVKSDADYITSVDVSPDTAERVQRNQNPRGDSDAVEDAIHPRYERNTASTRKARYLDGSLEWAVGSWVYDPVDEPWQHHIYLFENERGGTDIYGHKEISVRDPSGHVIDTKQTHGDPDGLLRDELDRDGIDYERHDPEHPSVPYPTVK